MIGPLLALLALICVLLGFFVLTRLISTGMVLERRWIVNLLELGAAALSIRAFFEGPGLLGGLIALLSLAGAGTYGILLALSKQSDQAPKIELGHPLPHFTALDENAKPFPIASNAASPLLIKFFRGHWCPYCVAELRQWKRMLPYLESKGIKLILISTDSPEQIRAGKTKHGLPGTFLSDRDLKLTRLYGLENLNRHVRPPGLSGLPIPTTILVDAMGVIRWIDQADDYQVRAKPERVQAAINAALDV